MRRRPWSVNLHHHGLLDSAVPAETVSVLDVGCGDGFLAARLAQRIPSVTAVDLDEPVLQRAQARFPESNVRWINGDIMTVPLSPPVFEAVVTNAALHHLGDTPTALRRLKTLVAPGGTLAVVAFVKASPRNALWHAASFVARGIAIRMHGKWEHTAPTLWPPPDTLQELRAHARTVLPAATVRRLLYGRVLLTWHNPTQP